MGAQLEDWLSREVVTLAWTWVIERRDGVTVALTTHDRALVRGDVIFEAAPGMAPSAISLSSSLEPETMDVAGVLTADAIGAHDLACGRWDGAMFTLGAIDWEDEAAEPLVIATGRLATVEQQGRHFTAELRGHEALLERPVVPFTSPGCRAQLGDRECRVDLAARRKRFAVMAIDDAVVTLDTGFAPGRYEHGRLRWIDGPLAGRSEAILAEDGARIELARVVGDAGSLPLRVELTEGCDRTLATCSGRFGNAANFRGEPHLPGNDLLTRYPGG